MKKQELPVPHRKFTNALKLRVKVVAKLSRLIKQFQNIKNINSASLVACICIFTNVTCFIGNVRVRSVVRITIDRLNAFSNTLILFITCSTLGQKTKVYSRSDMSSGWINHDIVVGLCHKTATKLLQKPSRVG